MLETKNSSLKRIKDINQASYLKLKKLKLHLEPEWEGNTAYWIFEDDGRADELIGSYINGDALGNLKEFSEAQKTLKQMLYNN
jgi:hypothetical protein